MTQAADPAALLRRLASIVGAEHVRDATEVDAIDGVRPRFLAEPETPTEVARALAAANAAGLSVSPRGGGTKSGWGDPPRAAGVVLSLARLNRVLEHAAGDMTATVEAGCTIDALQTVLAGRGQRLALDPLWPGRATVGGVLATGDAGPLRWAFGPPRDLVLGVTVALADGTLARSGGKVVKNVAGYDLPKLFTGSFGTLGVITQATFRLHPLPGVVRILGFRLSRDEVERFLAAMSECSLLTAAVQIRASMDEPPFACVRVEGPAEAVDSKSGRISDAATAAGAVAADLPSDGRGARERLFDGGGLVCKVGTLPMQVPKVLRLLRGAAESDGVRWRLVAQGFGVSLLRVEASDPVPIVGRLRSGIAELGGSLVVLRCPPERKREVGVWGESGDALPLMRRIKEQFDPAGTLNPGRFVGGI